jgi:hypothetical protein
MFIIGGNKLVNPVILAGGDSFIWGSELRDSPHGGPNGYSKKTFPALLAGTYWCAAYPGIGNTEIASRIKDTCRIKIFDLVIVCWTWPARDNILTSKRQIENLKEFFEYHRQPYLFTCADNCLLVDVAVDDNWFLFPPAEESWLTTKPRGFYQWAVENKYACGKQSHPLEEAHQAAAQLMQEKVNEMVTRPNQSD